MTNRKGETKRQHYVPRMVLRHFSKDGRRLSLLVKGKRIDDASLRDQCYEDYFYGEDNVLEKSFAADEAKVAALLGDLAPERFATLTPDHVEDLRLFLAYQHGRTKGAAEHLSQLGGALAKAILRDKLSREKDPKLRPEELDPVRIGLTNTHHESLWLTARLMPILLDLHVKFIATDRTPGFVIGDHPVVAYNQFAEHHPVLGRYPTRTGLTAKGLQFFLPLSPSMMLALFDPGTYEYGSKAATVCRAGPSDVESLNRMQAVNALSCVYFQPDRVTASSLARLIETRAQHPSMYVKQSTRGTVEEPDGRVRQIVLVHHPEIRLGAKLSFIRTIDGHSYDDHAGPSVPIRSRRHMQLAEEYGHVLDAMVEEGMAKLAEERLRSADPVASPKVAVPPDASVRNQVPEAGSPTSVEAADAAATTQEPAIPKWFPLGEDGDWLQETRWSRNLHLLRDRRGGVRALEALRAYFTPAWSKANQLDAPSHPVVHDAISIDGRYRLLEVGLMLAEMNQTKRLRQRLLPAREYEGTCAELRGGLLLRAAGAQVEWEPVKTGSGPDWLGRWPGGSLAMEVKRPRTSERAEAQYRVESDFMFEFMRAISDPPLVVDAGIWLTFHPSDAITKLKTNLGSVDMNAVRSLARDAAEGVRTAFPRPVQAGRFSAGHAGDFEIQQGADEPKVHLGMRHIARDHEHDAGRLLGLVQEAAEQVDRVPDVPGLVLIDTEGDFGVLNHRSVLLEALREKPWAKGLAGIALLSQTGTVDDAARELRTDSIVHIVPGPQVRALLDTLIGGLRICNREHFHFDPLLAPTAECTLTW